MKKSLALIKIYYCKQRLAGGAGAGGGPAPPRQKGLTDNFLKMELSPVSCLECWYLPIKSIKQFDLGF